LRSSNRIRASTTQSRRSKMIDLGANVDLLAAAALGRTDGLLACGVRQKTEVCAPDPIATAKS
jgi:hypothetical protein